MAVHSEGFTFKVGDSAGPDVYAELALLEVPEIFAGGKSTFARRTTADTGNTKIYGVGLEDGDDIALVCERDFTSTTQDLLRTAYAAGAVISCQFIFTDGTVVETSTAGFLVTSMPVTGTDPNGDGENVRQTFNVKRNSDWVTGEV